MGARAPTLITGQLAPQRRQLPQLIERSAFVRSRRNGSSTVDQDIAAEPKIVAGAAELVENGPRATDVAFERSRSLVLTVGPRRRVFLQGDPLCAVGWDTRLFTKDISAQNVRSAVCYFARRSLFRRHFHTRAWRVGAHVFVCAYPYTHHHTRMCALLDF